MWASARKSHGLVFFTHKKPFSVSQPFREIGMHIHDHFPAYTVRPTKKANNQIDRLAIWRAWSVLRISHYSGSTTSRVACLPSRSAATRSKVRIELATLPPFPI